MNNESKLHSMLAYLPLAVLAGLLGSAIVLFGSDATSGPVQVSLIVSGFIAAIVGAYWGQTWADHEAGIVTLVNQTTPALYIILMVGALIGVWMEVGTIPTIIYYGLFIVSPDYYYLAVVLVCALVAVSIGSSWTAAGTVGLAFVSIATASGLSPEITAGAVISGAYFGDKVSPLSDTTNLAAASTGANLFDHVRALMRTSVPAFLMSMLVFLAFGLGSTHTDTSDITAIAEHLDANYPIGAAALLPLLVMLLMAAKRYRPIQTLAVGILSAVILGIVRTDDGGTLIVSVWQAAGGGHASDTGITQLDGLLSRGGMSSMLSTIWLILSALFFGGAIEKSGCLQIMISHLIRSARTRGSLLRRAGFTAFFANIITPDQYLSIVVPARMYNRPFAKENMIETQLSRVLEDYGTVTSPLVPWNTCGAYMATTLGVATIDYIPFCIFCLTSPVLSTLISFDRKSAVPLSLVRS